MQIGIVGSGPAVAAIRAALTDHGADSDVGEIEASVVDEVDFAVVVKPAGAPAFERANQAALEGMTPWIAVELGGIGGQPDPSTGVSGDVRAAIAGFAPETGCYECLCARVASNTEPTASTDEESETEPDRNGDAQPSEADGDDEWGLTDADAPSIDRSTARLAGAIAGHEITNALGGAGDSVIGGVIEIPHAERRILPVPGCGCADERDVSLVREHESASLDEALARAERAFDGRVGIVSEVGEIDSFPAPYYLARSCDTEGFSDASAAREAAGVAAGWDAAFMKALGEALERYSAGIYREEAFEFASPDGPDDAIVPDSFVGRGDDADRTTEGDRTGADTDGDGDESIPWVNGEHLATGDAVSLPAEFVQFPPPERRFGAPITTGLGLGNSGAEALLSGLYEVIERDATMLAWYSTYEPLGLAIEDEEFEALARRARAENLAVTPLLVTQDVDVPVVSVAVHRDSWPRFAVGSGAALDPAAAARDALAEALQNWMELRRLGHDAAMDAEGAIGHYSEFPDPAKAFVAPETELPAASVGPANLPTGSDELDAVIERARDADVEAYAARLTPRDVEMLGFEAVRVLAPRAQPLFTDDAVFGERARTVPDDLGFESRLDRAFHPYP